MLGKVMKYEVRSGARQLLPLFGLGLAMSVLLRLLLWLAPKIWAPAGNVLNAMAVALGTLVLIAIVLITIASVVARFYQSMNGDEAYLTFTLPVKPSTHIWARLLVGTGYITLSGVVAWICGLIFIPGFGIGNTLNASINGVAYDLSGYEIPFGWKVALYALVAATLLFAIFATLLHIYAAMAIGQQFGRQKLLGSVVAYFVINTIESVLSLPLMLVPMFLVMGRSVADIEAWMLRWLNPEMLLTNPNLFIQHVITMVAVIVGIVIAVTLVFAILHYFIARHFYTKKLNLE